ncbi:glycosyltransferase family 28 [Sporolactobacillus sp. THM7-7]|nr:glycosyltransferase family 28 [Sporolactobacillus sp. THM7-7]
MIFVTVGTQKFQFNRLFQELDRLKENHTIQEEVIGQIGVTDYMPKNFQTFRFISSDMFEKYMAACRLMITHAGTSSIIQGLRNGKKVLVVPRRKAFAEHVDDHQVEIANLFKHKNYVETVNDISELGSKIKTIETRPFAPFHGNSFQLIRSIKQYLLDNIS